MTIIIEVESVESGNIDASLVQHRKITAKALDAIFYSNQGNQDNNVSIKFSFTTADLDNGILRKYHGLNSDVVDVSVRTNTNIEVEVPVLYDNANQVSLDFNSLLPLIGTWQVLIEA